MKRYIRTFKFVAAKSRPARGAMLALMLLLSGAPNQASGAPQERYLTGQLLVAAEEMADGRFAETVIYIVRHDAQGAMGLVLNRPIAKGPIDDLIESFGGAATGSKTEVTVHYGGPVSRDAGFMLHSDDVMIESSTRVKDGIAMTTDIRLVEALARGQGPKQTLVLLGYAGWAEGQLEAELREESWHVIGADKLFIFDKNAETKWRRALDKRQIPL